MTYNTFGELETDEARAGATVLFSTVYTRDDTGRIVQLDELANGVSRTLEYAYVAAPSAWAYRQI